MNDIIYASATSLARAIRAQELSSAEVVHVYLCSGTERSTLDDRRGYGLMVGPTLNRRPRRGTLACREAAVVDDSSVQARRHP
jgi:hypothetical protein